MHGIAKAVTWHVHGIAYNDNIMAVHMACRTWMACQEAELFKLGIACTCYMKWTWLLFIVRTTICLVSPCPLSQPCYVYVRRTMCLLYDNYPSLFRCTRGVHIGVTLFPNCE